VSRVNRPYNYLNPTNAVFLNQISMVPPEKKYESRPEIVIGWGGSHGHLEDMAEVSEPLIEWIISRDNVKLYLMCSDPIWSLFQRLPQTRKQRFKTGSLNDYYAFLKKIDVGLVPLKDTAFNRSRSDIKFLEYAVHGVVPVMQASVPYVSSVKHGKTGFLFEDAEGMLNVLEILTENIHLISKVAKAARDYVIKERLQHQHGKERTKFYRTKLPERHSKQKGRNGARKIFEASSRIKGAARNGRHLRLMPTRFENLLHDGLVLGQIEHKEALAHSFFSEASGLEPNNYMPYLFGASYSGDTAGWLHQAIERNPHSVKSWILLGEEYARKGDIVKAIKSFESAAEIFPEYEIPYLRSAELLQKLGHQKEAVYFTEKAEALTSPLLSPTEGLIDNKELAREP